MFQNMPAALQAGGSAEFFYNELKNVYNRQKKIMKDTKSRYTKLYGQQKSDEFGVSNYSPDSYTDFASYQDALKAKGEEAYSERSRTRQINEAEFKKSQSLRDRMNNADQRNRGN